MASDETLRGAGLSAQKVAYLRDLAVRAEAGLPLARWHASRTRP